MKRVSGRWLLTAVLGALLCGSVAAVWAGEKEKKVKLESLPDPVKQSILKEAGDHKLKDIEETSKNGQVIYEADWLVDGKEMEVQVSADGKVVKKAEEEAEKDEDKHEEREGGQHGDEKASWTDSFDLSKCVLASTGRNDYFILEPGYQLVLEHGSAKLEVTVLNETRRIGDVETRIVEERETVDGEVKEVSRNFFAFCNETGSVFYFGEETDAYKQGKATPGTDGWIAGTDNAKPGLMMPGLVLVGARYYQEIAPGKAMDRAEVVGLNETLDTPAGHFEHCLKTEETTPLEHGEREYKLYAPGIGLIKDEDLVLTHSGAVNK